MKVNKDCKACGGRGLNSMGNPCHPCQENGVSVPTTYIHCTACSVGSRAGCKLCSGDGWTEAVPQPTRNAEAHGREFPDYDPALEGF